MKAFFLFFFLFHSAFFAESRIAEHDIHLSLCEIRFNEKSSSFEVAIKIFIDDLESAIQKQGVKGFRIEDDKNETIDTHIASYLQKNFSIEIDGIRLHGSFLGKEMSEDLLAVWCFVEYQKETKSARKCVVSNNVLMEIYDDQRNIMDIRMSKSHKDYIILGGRMNSWTYTYEHK